LNDDDLLWKHGLSVESISERTLLSAKKVIAAGVKEFFLKPDQVADMKYIIESYEERGLFDDLNSHETVYGEPLGVFLVLMAKAGKVAGMGGVRRLSDDIAELKRMWFLPAYRGHGLGRWLAEELIEFARKAGYKIIRLDSGSNLHQALALYRKLGFREIGKYNGSVHCDVFMELVL